MLFESCPWMPAAHVDVDVEIVDVDEVISIAGSDQADHDMTDELAELPRISAAADVFDELLELEVIAAQNAD